MTNPSSIQRLAFAKEQFLQGNIGESRMILQTILDGGRSGGKSVELAAVLFLRTSDIDSAKGRVDFDWQRVLGVFGGVSKLPVSVVLAGTLRFAAAGDISGAASLFEAWVTQANCSNSTPNSAYPMLARAYVLHVLAARRDWAVAREFVDLDTALDKNEKQALLADIQVLQNKDDLKEITGKEPELVVREDENNSSANTKPKKHAPTASNGAPLSSQSISATDTGKPAISNATQPAPSNKPVANAVVNTASDSLSIKSKHITSSTPPSPPQQPKKPTLKVLLQFLRKHGMSVFSFLAFMAAVFVYKFRDAPASKSFVLILQRFLRTLQMASTIG